MTLEELNKMNSEDAKQEEVAALRNKVKTETLLDVLMRLHEMVAKGEVLASGISGVPELLESLLAGEKEDCGFFITEYLVLEAGQASIVRRALADWPFWADNLNPLSYVQGVPKDG